VYRIGRAAYYPLDAFKTWFIVDPAVGSSVVDEPKEVKEVHMSTFLRSSASLAAALAVAVLVLAGLPSMAQQRARVRAAAVATAPQDAINQICDPERVRQNRRGDTVTFRCAATAPIPASQAPQNLAARPTVQRATITGECKEVNGVMTCSKWTCTQDADSNCKTFINWCVDQGGDVNGNGGGASCGIP
jgi:hypothetical protein